VLPDLGHELHAELIARAMEQLRTFVPARVWKAAMEAAKEQKLD
jgi:phospholipase/carboxylesterase